MNEPLRLSPADVTDWFMECDNADGDHKIPHVILNDKLMTDALLGTIPIKTEHSYSLTSDGDSMPDSPSGTKIEGEFLC
jgi:cyclic AMP-responsive element-binding protein 3